MTKYTTVWASLLRYLSRFDFEDAVSAYGADRNVRRLSTWELFKAMLYGQITGCFSVREIVHSLSANASRLYHAGMKAVKRSTFCDAMEKRPAAVFQSMFYSISEKAQGLSGRIKKQFKDPLRIIDATTIPLCLAKCEWAAFRQKKGGVKMHLGIDGDSLLPIDAYLTDGKTHEINRMLHLCHESGVIYVMDRGYVDYKSLYSIELNGSIFVTRMKSGGSYKRVKNIPHGNDEPVISDVIIELTGPVTKKHYPKQLRKVKCYDEETKRTYEFITNNFILTAEEIAKIYKERWQIELFFKWLKQNLKIKTFWGTSQNAVFSQIWVALILSVLLWICKWAEGITDTAHTLLQKLKTTLLAKRSILDVCISKPPPDPVPDIQPCFEAFL